VDVRVQDFESGRFAEMKISFVPFTVLWALIAIVVLALIAYRKLVSFQEEETLHLGNAAEANHQAVIGRKLDWIDKWGKLLTVIAVVYGVLLAAAYTYRVWLVMQATGA
jgi:hypothetical protein